MSRWTSLGTEADRCRTRREAPLPIPNRGGRRVLWWIAGMLLLAAAPQAAEGLSPNKLSVFVGIPPLEGLAAAVGGDRVVVRSLVPGGQSPHTYDPTPRQVAALASADLYFSVELPFEKTLIGKVRDSAQGLRILDISQGIERRQMVGRSHDRPAHDHDAEGHAGHDHDAEGHAGHDHDAEGHAGHDHDAEGHAGHDHHAGALACGETHGGEPETGMHADPHIWMAPDNLTRLARRVAKAFTEADPAGAEVYRSNLARYEDRIQALEAELARDLAPFADKPLYVYHPAFGYFTDAFGLVQTAVEIEGKEPTPRQLAALIDRARGAGVRLLIVQPQFDPRSAQTVADAIGGTVVPVDPLAEDIPAQLRRLAEAVRAGAAPESPAKPGEDS